MSLKRFFFAFFFAVVAEIFPFPFLAAAKTIVIPFAPDTIRLNWDGNEESVSPEIIASWFEPRNTLQFQREMETEALSPKLCPWTAFFCDFSLIQETRYSINSKTIFSFNEDSAKNFLADLRERTRQHPIDAIFTANLDGTVSAFAPSRDGSEIDIESGMRTLKKAIVDSTEKDLDVSLPTLPLRPRITSTDADRLGITKFLGEGRTSFAGSPRNRVFNINRAIEQFQGILIAPGEEFSFVEHLGEVDGEHGYLPELVIKRGETLPEFGGGICQVSTTIFRAALNTGQKITERRNHAYPVQYYKPYGMDATIYIPKPDFKFINNTPAHILIQVAIEEKELVFRFYGTPDERKVEIEGPHITARTPEGGMKTVFTQKVTAADGTTLIEDTFKSSYESPSKYPHPGEEKLTEKPANWSEKQWNAYVATGALPR